MKVFSRPALLIGPLVAGSALLLMLSTPSTSFSRSKDLPVGDAIYEDLLKQYPDMDYSDLVRELPNRTYLDKLSFDPGKVKFYDEAVENLKMTDREKELFKKNGFVTVDHDQRYSFGSAYYAVWTRDLPVLVTASSILHALHKSYDSMLEDMEIAVFTPTITNLLTKIHDQMAVEAKNSQLEELAHSYKDLDLYLTVSRNLLAGAGAPVKHVGKTEDEYGRKVVQDKWGGELLIKSYLGQDAKALEILKFVQSLKIQVQFQDKPTMFYGTEHYMDYSQFRPRGHYSKSTALKRYFRCMMWLGRADTGLKVLPDPQQPGQEDVVVNYKAVKDLPKAHQQSIRELKTSVLMTSLIYSTGQNEKLKGLDDFINFMVGESDNLKVFALKELMKDAGIEGPEDLADFSKLMALQVEIKKGKHAQQLINSQNVVSGQNDTYKVPSPSQFQMFGQRFVIDSYVMSKVVFDEIIYQNKKQERRMPKGLDVMAALGNDAAVPLLKGELEKWNYSANVMAARDFVDQQRSEFWDKTICSLWLDSLRALDDDKSSEEFMPQAMKTKEWQHYQLQTQLASWSQLRHDSILYAKQGYGAVAGCEYPAGYVEPYPEFYKKLKHYADTALKGVEAMEYTNAASRLKNKQVNHFKNLSKIMSQLIVLSEKELNGEKFTEDEVQFLQAWIDMRRFGSGGQTMYDGWYIKLFYNGECDATKWDPIVADVHTDPNTKQALEVATGDVTFLVMAIDNGEDRMVYVGPTFSYYEFQVGVQNRMTDQEWQDLIKANKLPKAPSWTSGFQGDRVKRDLAKAKRLKVSSGRERLKSLDEVQKLEEAGGQRP